MLPIQCGASFLFTTVVGQRDACEKAIAAATKLNEEGFCASVVVMDDDAWAGIQWRDLRKAALAADSQAAVMFVVDDHALSAGNPLLVVDLWNPEHPPFRCRAEDLWSVDNNLNIGNMDWSDFADSVGSDGVFRSWKKISTPSASISPPTHEDISRGCTRRLHPHKEFP